MRPSTPRLWIPFVLSVVAAVLVAPRPTYAGSLKPDGRAGGVTSLQGVAMVRPVGRERWTPLDARALLWPGDVVRTETRGANALDVRLAAGGKLVLGPGTVLEFPDAGGLRLLRGELEVAADAKAPVQVVGTGGFATDVAATAWLRATDTETKALGAAPRWLEGYRASTSEEWMGSLLATVDGKNVPLTVGYHKVTVEIRDQIARTTVEESFVNGTIGTLEGVFSFPLPADASISGFGMWIGDELVEADLVEKQRARAIYEDILRRKKDPGLLEWEGGNLFKARVFPIFPHSEKRIRLRYTQVLPLEGDAYRYRYALRSELLRLNPLRELSMSVAVTSSAAIREVSSPTHPITLRATEHEAIAEFGAQQYVPERDFELAVTVGRGSGLAAVAHRRGDDGFFMLMLAPPDAEGAGWKRDLVPEGAPLDVVLVADTSGSMDPAARDVQATFLAGLLAQLSAKDRFRLVACDVEPVWLVAEPTAATEEAAAKALAALDARFSLGWTDLDQTLDAVLGRVAPGTQVVYVGDGIPTAGDGDAVALADRIRRKAAGAKATFHAVSTSSAYEQGVLDALASVGGGSVRRADSGAVEAARALLGEVARPGLRDARVEIRGVPTAKVYPEVLPNLPLTAQQVVLGRFLPGGDAKTAEIVVTGRVGGAPVRYTSSFTVPAAEEGNSFLPRLWARRHLDVLLAQGQSPATKEEIVAFSREYEIMTPYTSFLVLENDEDRARYGVERTVHMRDAERFFAQARDTATLEITRKQMATARRWRVELRRAALAEIGALGRDLPIGAGYGWTEGGFEGPPSSGELRDGKSLGVQFGGGGGGRFPLRGGFRGHGGAVPPGLREPSDPSAPPPAPMAAAPAGGDDVESGVDDAESDADMPTDEAGAEEEAEKLEEDANLASARDVAKKSKDDTRENLRMRRSVATNGLIGIGERRRSLESAGRPRGAWNRSGPAGGPAAARFDASALGFPGLEAPPKDDTTKPPPDPTWDPAVLEALRALNRRPALAAFPGVLRIAGTTETLHPVQGTAQTRARSTTTMSSRRWLRTSDGFRAVPTTAWLSEAERVVVNEATRLGRRRAAGDGDRGRWENLALGTPSRDGYVAALAASYLAPTVTRDGDRLRLVFVHRTDAASRFELTVDTVRKVVVEERSVRLGRTVGATRYDGFVVAAGLAWATRVEHVDEDGHVVSRTTLVVETVEPAAFDAALDAAAKAAADVFFLGAAEPTLLEAQQAVHDQHATPADLLVVASAHGAAGRWDDFATAWAAFERAVGDRPGAAWMRLAALAPSRRGVETAAQATTMAAACAADASPFAPARAALLDDRTGVLGPTERLALVEGLGKAWSRAGPDVDLWSVYGRRRVAVALAGAGEPDRALAAYAALAQDRPADLTDALGYANALRQGEDLEGALRVVADRAGRTGLWSRGEGETLFGTWTAWLWEFRDLPKLDEVANAWVATGTANGTAHQLAWSIAYYRGRSAEADAAILAALAADVVDVADPVAFARRSAAVQFALGQGWNFWSRTVAEPWRAPLADVVVRLSRTDGARVELAGTILSDWRFRNLEAYRAAVVAMRADLVAPGAIAPMPYARLRFLVGHALDGADDATRATVAAALVARWRTTAAWADAEPLATLALQVMPSGGRDEERIAFLRERLGRAPAENAPGAARQLFAALVDAPYEAPREDEAFALVPRTLGPDTTPGEATAASVAAASAARTLAAWVHEGRFRALLGTPPPEAPWTRADTTRRTREARAKARGETAARFATAVPGASARLRPWFEIERIGYAAEAAADLAKTEGEARELLEAIPAGSEEAMDALLAERCAVVLAYAATRRAAPAGLADRVVALLRARLAAKDRLLDDRAQLFRLLVALDRPDELATELASWIRPDDVDVTWAVALATLHAERGELRPAATLLETASARGDLDEATWAALADWYLVLKEDARRDAALDRALAMQQEWQVQQRLYQASNRLQRHGDGVPEALDPESLRALRFLLQKAPWPNNYVGHVTALYRPTKDFRVLEALADGVPGHSAEAVYAYLQIAAAVVAEIHEEATCDALGARIATVLAGATRDVDRRALRLLLVTVEARAASVPKADPAHGVRALAALRAAFDGALVPGERVPLAQRLAQLGTAAPAGLPEEQLARLEALLAGASDARERLRVGRWLTQALWDRARKDEAIDRLDALLAAVRAASGGTLAPEALEAHQALLSWWVERRLYRAAETRLRADLGSETRSMRRELLRLRLFDVYREALAHGGATALGAGRELFEVAGAEMERYLVEGPGYQLAAGAQRHAAFHATAAKASPVPDVGARYFAFARDRLPAILLRDPTETGDILGAVLPTLRAVAGPKEALAVALDQVERGPRWFERVDWDLWSRQSHAMAGWRHEAGGGIADLEARLLPWVLGHLEASLLTGQQSGHAFWWRHNGWFWEAKRADFAAVAARVAEVHASEPTVALHVANYQRGGLDLRREPIATLQMALAQGKDPEDVRWQLAVWLAEDDRHAEAWPLLERLVVSAPDNVAYVVLAAKVAHRLGCTTDALALLERAVARWKAAKTWSEDEAAQVAMAALDAGHPAAAATWIDDALRMRREHGGGSGPDGTLSAWYGVLARARGALGDTDGAVQAAAAAVVAWGRSYDERASALTALRGVLADAKDLDAWVARHEAEVARSGLDAPVLRASVGWVYLDRGNPDRAAAQLRIARDLDPTDATVHAMLVRALDALGDGAGALDALRTSVRVAPRNLAAYPDLAARFARAQDEANAERARTNLVEAMPAEVDGHRALAEIREAAKRFDLAVERWRAVVRIRADEPAGWLSLAKAQRAAGDPVGARATLDHVLQGTWDARFGDVRADAARLLESLR